MKSFSWSFDFDLKSLESSDLWFWFQVTFWLISILIWCIFWTKSSFYYILLQSSSGSWEYTDTQYTAVPFVVNNTASFWIVNGTVNLRWMLLVNHSFMLVQILPEWNHWITCMTEKNLQILSRYTNVCSTFLKYNTSLQSSALIELLFSIGGLISTPRRNKLSDAVRQQ